MLFAFQGMVLLCKSRCYCSGFPSLVRVGVMLHGFVSNPISVLLEGVAVSQVPSSFVEVRKRPGDFSQKSMGTLKCKFSICGFV